MKKLVKILVVIMVMSLMALALVGCGESADVVTYKACTEPTFPPFDTTDEDGNLVGFDMDLMNAIGEDQGFKVEYVALEFDALIPAIQAGDCDIITAGMNAMDPERQAKVDFSTTYYDSALVVLVKSDSTITGIDALTKDMVVASQTGTTGADEANALAADGKVKEAIINDAFTTCVLQLQSGDVDAVIIDKPVAESYVKKQGSTEIKVVGEGLNAESYGFAVQKGNSELLEKINKGLQNMIDNGTYDALVEKWFN